MTELESTILAVVVRDGPISAYGVRKVFAGSSTPSWSSSTGAIYPCVRRLIDAGLLISNSPEGSRRKQTLSATSQGRAAVRTWLSHLDADTAAANPDPVRTRAFFLGTLAKGSRLAFVERALGATAEALRQVEQEIAAEREAGVDAIVIEAGAGAAYELRARQRWLEALRKVVSR